MFEYSSVQALKHRPRAGLAALLVVCAGLVAVPSLHAQSNQLVPAVRFHVATEELLQMVYPDRYQSDAGVLESDIEWVEDEAERLLSWWSRDGLAFLQRVTDYAGLDWPYRDIDVYVVRFWPVVSIERPLVVALDAVRSTGRQIDVPEDDDVRILLIAHQVTHYLLDDPSFSPRVPRDAAYDHPFMAPGDYAVEALVNWVTYRSLEDLWGRERLREATGDELWRLYNPNHAYVVDELEPRHRLSSRNPLVEWLDDNPAGSEIFRVREAYLRQRGTPRATPAIDRERISGTEYGIDLGASHDGRIFIAYVDAESPAARVGIGQGDVLRTIEGRDVPDTVGEAQTLLDESWENNGEINLSVQREGREVFFSIEAP